MAIWNKLKEELDSAGKMAQGALDEGKVRLDSFRTRQLADKAAQVLGYAVYRARAAGQELDTDTYSRLSSTLAVHEIEASRLEDQLSDMLSTRKSGRSGTNTSDSGGPTTPGATSATTGDVPPPV
ncbi:MAG: hypothetical protein ACR2G6_01970 [Gemmatimonadaceae bacterium]